MTHCSEVDDVMEEKLLHFLVPLDGSPTAESILPLVVEFSTKIKASVTLLHVIEHGAPAEVHGERHLQKFEDAEKYLAKMCADLISRGVQCSYHVHPNEVGNVPASIIAHCREMSSDCVAMCSHGWGGIRDVFWGTIPQQVLRESPSPVLLLPPQLAGASREFVLRQILLPVDIEHSHDLSFDSALFFASHLGAVLHLLSIVPHRHQLPGVERLAGRYLFSAGHEVLEIEVQGVQDHLEEHQKQCAEAGVESRIAVRRGDSAEEIAAYAEENRIDLIVLPSHAHSGLSAFFQKSTGSRVMTRVPCPVLVMRIGE